MINQKFHILYKKSFFFYISVKSFSFDYKNLVWRENLPSISKNHDFWEISFLMIHKHDHEKILMLLVIKVIYEIFLFEITKLMIRKSCLFSQIYDLEKNHVCWEESCFITKAMSGRKIMEEKKSSERKITRNLINQVQ